MISPLPEPDKGGFLNTIRGAAESLWGNLKRVISTPFGQQTTNPAATPAGEQTTQLPGGGTRTIFNKPISSPVNLPGGGTITDPRMAASPTPSASPTPVPKLREQGDIGLAISKIWPPAEFENISLVLDGENRGRNPMAENYNSDGSTDRGIMQINSNTFADFMRRKGNILKGLGINSYDDMYDPVKNIIMGKLIFDEQGWSAWYGAPGNLRG